MLIPGCAAVRPRAAESPAARRPPLPRPAPSRGVPSALPPPQQHRGTGPPPPRPRLRRAAAQRLPPPPPAAPLNARPANTEPQALSYRFLCCALSHTASFQAALRWVKEAINGRTTTLRASNGRLDTFTQDTSSAISASASQTHGAQICPLQLLHAQAGLFMNTCVWPSSRSASRRRRASARCCSSAAASLSRCSANASARLVSGKFSCFGSGSTGDEGECIGLCLCRFAIGGREIHLQYFIPYTSPLIPKLQTSCMMSLEPATR